MLVLGMLLVLLAAGVIAGVAVGGSTDTARFDVGFVDASMSTSAVFLVGALAMLVLLLGLVLIRTGARRANRQRKDRRELSRLSKKLESQDSRGTAAHGPGTAQRLPDEGPTSTRPQGPTG